MNIITVENLKVSFISITFCGKRSRRPRRRRGKTISYSHNKQDLTRNLIAMMLKRPPQPNYSLKLSNLP